MRKSVFFTALLLTGAVTIGNALSQEVFEGEKPAVQTADRLEWAWDGGDRFGIGGSAVVHYQPGGQPRIIVRGPADLLSRVRFYHGELRMVDSLFGFHWDDEKLDVTLTGMTLHRVGVAGSGAIHMGEIHQDRLALSIAGSGSFDASGKVDDLSLHIAGSGRGDLAKLATTSLSANIAGSGKIDAGTADKADISIAGSGEIHFTGPMPKQLSTNIMGSGEVSDSEGRVITRRQARRDSDFRAR
jgi:hypothetical protein